jgi:hypothetical protein
MPKKIKIPTFQEAVDELGPEAMSFFMDMTNQGDPNRGEEIDKADHELPTPPTPEHAKELPSGSHFIDPKGKRRRVP